MKIKQDKYGFYTHGELQPTGWLKNQLDVQARGLSPVLDEVWDNIGDSAWIGGSGDGWERLPYWLDGFIPLAYLLRDKALIAKVESYMTKLFEHQDADGWIAPCPPEQRRGYDLWAVFLMLKATVQYADFSGDERARKYIHDALLNVYRQGELCSLFHWGLYRWFDALIPIFWLYDKTGEEWLLLLAQRLKVEGADFGVLGDFWLHKESYKGFIGNSYITHVVNLAMGLRASALWSRIDGDTSSSKRLLKQLNTWHGDPLEFFYGDESLAGTDCFRGTELCAVAEGMFSFERLFAADGDCYWRHKLAMLAYNAFPTVNSEDMWTHQYVHITNQIAAARLESAPDFRCTQADAQCFGFEPNYPCCTVNFSQGWPKFALCAIMSAQDGVLFTTLAPARVDTNINGSNVTFECRTDYPFSGGAEYIITCADGADITVSICVPHGVAKASLDGSPVRAGSTVTVKRFFKGTVALKLDFSLIIKKRRCPGGMDALIRGETLLAMPIAACEKRSTHYVDGKPLPPECDDRDYYPLEPWGYAFASGRITAHEHGVGSVPFSRSAPPVTVDVPVYPVAWETRPGSKLLCAPRSGKVIGPKTEKTFVPYGCTILRMAVMPSEMPEKP